MQGQRSLTLTRVQRLLRVKRLAWRSRLQHVLTAISAPTFASDDKLVRLPAPPHPLNMNQNVVESAAAKLAERALERVKDKRECAGRVCAGDPRCAVRAQRVAKRLRVICGFVKHDAVIVVNEACAPALADAHVRRSYSYGVVHTLVRVSYRSLL